MTLTTPLQTAQYRPAHHYLNKLRAADKAVRCVQSSATYGLALFDHDLSDLGSADEPLCIQVHIDVRKDDVVALLRAPPTSWIRTGIST